MQRIDLTSKVDAIFPHQARQSAQGTPYAYGISAETAGSTDLSMHLVEIPPGHKTDPHYHHHYETAIYVLAGRVETRYGEGLRHSVVNEAGSFLFIPPGVPHQAINLNLAQPVLAIVARSHAEAKEVVEDYEFE
ncbi:cupin domain-containing protein [Chloroflexi bacterium TSY]|nr:cupin domain-containing protein [Chloroflexi bacterium TSY]